MDNAAVFVKSWTKLTKDWNAQMEAELAPQLTAGQLEVLELLQVHEPMKPSDLLPHLETTPAAITTLLDRMERGGLVERNRDEGDRRIVWVTMTALGRSEAERGLSVRSAIVNRSLEQVSSHNRQLLVYLISKVAGTRESVASGERKVNISDSDSDNQDNNVESSAISS
ncbi:MarR family winged helix-turn-helix transcriptional regulator [Cohnella mopanensis]|uniref:MarR family winged helix-turn-helix transcriptional regulator n=1 Tax=Cohnella mopanensis TaxID=2911966 RepID=UPI0034E28BBE